MFAGWENFYLLVGGASGSLIGLLFIVSTLNRRLDRDSVLRGASVYMSPVVLQLAAVLTISALACAPALARPAAGVLLAAGAVVATVASVRVTVMILFDKQFASSHWTDVWCYGVLPLAGDLALAASAASVWLWPALARPGGGRQRAGAAADRHPQRLGSGDLDLGHQPAAAQSKLAPARFSGLLPIWNNSGT